MAVLRPLKIVLDNYPEDKVEMLEAVNNPEDPAAGKRQIPFSRTLYIDQDDFREDPPKKFFRLAPGAEVRLRYAYIIKCVSVTKDPSHRRHFRSPLHLRSGNKKRHAPGRSQSERHHPLGLRTTCRDRTRAPLRLSVFQARSGRSAGPVKTI